MSTKNTRSALPAVTAARVPAGFIAIRPAALVPGRMTEAACPPSANGSLKRYSTPVPAAAPATRTSLSEPLPTPTAMSEMADGRGVLGVSGAKSMPLTLLTPRLKRRIRVGSAPEGAATTV
ncbi:hypothetical protein [Microbacterium sp. SORGH_AS_0862]|uniref:hypothetical protein n=1 Tax=Microbacterium sp. SORGH_AS_0862 TaxID=3041789 RepID=UPI0035947B17